jgi:hypothetical protein
MPFGQKSQRNVAAHQDPLKPFTGGRKVCQNGQDIKYELVIFA